MIGTAFFILAAIVKGLDMIDTTVVYYKILNIIFYVISLILITKAIISFDNTKNSNFAEE